MPNFTATKTVSVEVLAHQECIHPTSVIGSWIDCSSYITGTLYLFHGYVENTLDTNFGKFIVQSRPDSGSGSVHEHAVPHQEFFTKGTDPDHAQLSGSESAGDGTLAVASTTGFANTDLLYIQDVNVVADGEWATLQSFVANTSITLMNGLTNAKDSSDIIYNDASMFVMPLDLRAISSFRVIWSHQGTTGANCHIKALAVVQTAYGS